MVGNKLENLRKKTPLIHCITNYVTVNDCANILLACGGSPIMADDEEEVEEIVSISSGLCINIGTLNQNSIQAMLKAGKKAKEQGKVVLLDPVGAGASKLRTKTVIEIVKTVKPDVIRANVTEMKALIDGSSNTTGVDASIEDVVTEDNLDKTIEILSKFSKEKDAVVAVTGKIDIVTDSETAFLIKNGDPIMGKITGAGCQLSAMTTAFLAANPRELIHATTASICAMGVAGEIGKERMSPMDGNSSFRNYLIDAIYNLTPKVLEERAVYEKC